MRLCAARDKLTELHAWTESISAAWESCRECLASAQLDHETEEFRRIDIALENIAKGPEQPDPDSNQRILFQTTAENTFKAVTIFLRAITKPTTPPEKEIEKKLFRLAFTPGDGGARVYPVYFMHDTFLETPETCCLLKSSTGSGKTRCAPFFIALKSLSDGLTKPFCILTRPNWASIRDNMKDFSETLGDSVILTDHLSKLEELLEVPVSKPVICFCTPHGLVRFLAPLNKRDIIVQKCRFVLDEIHERQVDTDVMLALLAGLLNDSSTPLHLLMMSATPDLSLIHI